MIPGLTIIPDFITKSEEEALLLRINGPWDVIYQNRAVREFGKPIYPEETEKDIPRWLAFLIYDKGIKGSFGYPPTHVSITKYEKGGYITPHIDKPGGGELISILSFLSDAEMVFTKEDNKLQVKVPRRSLLQLRGEARWGWKHELLPVLETRYSIIFRG